MLQLRVGFANEIQKPIPVGLTVTCPDQTHILIKGSDKQMVGQFAAEVRSRSQAGALQRQGRALRWRGGAPQGWQGDVQVTLAPDGLVFGLDQSRPETRRVSEPRTRTSTSEFGSKVVNHEKSIYRQRVRRGFRVRKRIHGTAERPRLSVFRSHKHMYAQAIDDADGRTLASASTAESEVRGEVKFSGNKTAAQVVGKAIAERLIAAGITAKRPFDRGAFQYHGRIAALADAARSAGLEF